MSKWFIFLFFFATANAEPFTTAPISPINGTVMLAQEIAKDGQSAVILGALIVVLMIVLVAVIVWLPRTLFRILERSETRHTETMRDLHTSHAAERGEFLVAIIDLRNSMHDGLGGVTDRLTRLEIGKEMRAEVEARKP